jgi:serine/threonine-protein kinase HipA
MQQMRVGQDQGESTLENAMSMCNFFGLNGDQAADEVRRVIAVVDRWQAVLADIGVGSGDLDLLSEQIDRPFLLSQRRDF